MIRRQSGWYRVSALATVCLFALITWRQRQGLAEWSSIRLLRKQPQLRSPKLRTLNATFVEEARPVVKAILNVEDRTMHRLQCPALQSGRYDYLKYNSNGSSTNGPKFFFALDLHQSALVLPRLLGSVVEVAKFLGFSNCALSIVEGRSDDGTLEILASLDREFAGIGFEYHLTSSDINPLQGDRVEGLAALRNLALAPLVNVPSAYYSGSTVIFLNDVAICSEDILELIHQRVYQKADMTCAMDWTYLGPDPTFYDVWIARGMTGEPFFDIPSPGNWDFAWNLFWDDEKSQSALNRRVPFQVFSCWNGAVTFDAKVLDKVRFRQSYDGECYAGEPRLFCKDMWYQGFSRIAVVPSVNVEYSDDAGRRIKELKGFTSQHLRDDRIEWDGLPPENVKCEQDMRPWDEGLAENGVFAG